MQRAFAGRALLRLATDSQTREREREKERERERERPFKKNEATRSRWRGEREKAPCCDAQAPVKFNCEDGQCGTCECLVNGKKARLHRVSYASRPSFVVSEGRCRSRERDAHTHIPERPRRLVCAWPRCPQRAPSPSPPSEGIHERRVAPNYIVMQRARRPLDFS